MSECLEIVAHRGWATRYPENTMSAICGALAAGARYVEFDVQLSRDGVPVVIHDPTLERTAGRPECVMDLDWAALARIEVGPAPASERLSSLASVARALTAYAEATVFVELKSESIDRFGTSNAVAAVLAAIAPIRERCVLTSFDDNALAEGRASGAQALAWVLSHYDDESLERARALAPEYLFCNHRKLPDNDRPLPTDGWHWVIYEVTTPELARSLAARGVGMVETMAAGELLAALGAPGERG